MNKERQEEVGQTKSPLGGKWEVGELRALASHLPFLPGKLLLTSSTQKYWVYQILAPGWVGVGGTFPKGTPSSSHWMAFVFPEVTSKGKQTGIPWGGGRQMGVGVGSGEAGGGRHSDLDEFEGPSKPPHPPEWEPITSSCPPHPAPPSTRDCVRWAQDSCFTEDN